MTLLHGTTRRRAEQLIVGSPDPRFQEPGGQAWDDGFSMSLKSGPFHFGTPEEYARLKAAAFPDEGGPVILEVDVPEEIIAKAVNEWFPLSQGLVQFDWGAGLEELTSAWPALEKRLVDVFDE
jgi:hypothetical protein